MVTRPVICELPLPLYDALERWAVARNLHPRQVATEFVVDAINAALKREEIFEELISAG